MRRRRRSKRRGRRRISLMRKGVYGLQRRSFSRRMCKLRPAKRIRWGIEKDGMMMRR